MIYIPSKPQQIARDFLIKKPDVFLLMGMGLGKTATIVDFYNHMAYERFDLHGALIVAPIRVCNLTWPAEVKKYDHTRHLKVANLREEAGRKAFMRGSADIYLINWEGLRTVPRLLAKKTSGKIPYDMVVFDESTKGKSPTSVRTAEYKKYCPRVKRHIAMTGTPSPNSLMDLWGQMALVDDGKRLGKSANHFQQTFFQKHPYNPYKWGVQPDAKQRIYKRISDVTLTLRSSEWLDLPDVVLEDVDVPMHAHLVRQYKDFETDLITQIQGEDITAANSAALITKLLQFTSGAVYDLDRVVHHIHDLKINALRETAKRIGGPALVAVAYQHEQDRLRKAFPKAEFMADAKTAASQVSLIDRWNAGKVSMLIAHPGSMSHGLNMQGQNRIIWYSLTYNKDFYEQMIGRLYRRGQDNVVYCYRLMVPDTVDWAVAEALRYKADEEGMLLTALQNLEAFRAAGGVVDIEPEEGLDDGLDDL